MRTLLARDLVGKTISGVALLDDAIHVTFSDGSPSLEISDTGQKCCECRYITSDHSTEDLAQFVGATLVGIETRDLDTIDTDDDGTTLDDDLGHERASLVLVTSLGNIDFVTHNIHNGYYSGFVVAARLHTSN